MNIFDGTGMIPADYALAVLITLSAVLTYARIAFETSSLRFPYPRMVIAVGFSILSFRFWWTLSHGGDVMVAPLSLVALGMISAGYCAIQLLGIRRAIRMTAVDIKCFRDPELPCAREDRIHEAIVELKRGKA